MKTHRGEGRAGPSPIGRVLASIVVAACLHAPSNAADRRGPVPDAERICRAEQGTCLQRCIMTSRSADASRSCQQQCASDLDACRQRDAAPATSDAGPVGPALDDAAIKDIARRIREAMTRQQQAVAVAYSTPPAVCQERTVGMMRDPRACLEARTREHAAAATGERDTILSLLAEAEASLDADVAGLPTGQIQRYKAMESFNAKYDPIVTITRGLARGGNAASTDVPVQVASERFERKRLAATGGQEAALPAGRARASRSSNAPID